MHFLIFFLFSFIVFCNSASGESVLRKSEEKLLELKTDVDKVGDDFENLAFDVMKQVMNKVGMFEINGDYYTEDEVEAPREILTQYPTTKKMLDNVLENTTEKHTTERAMNKSTTNVESNTTLKNVLENYNVDLSKRRSKRSVDANTSDIPKKEPIVAESLSRDNSKCPEKSLNELTLEHRHIADLKDEVNKLYNIVMLLRDQQKLISLLDEGTTNLKTDLPKRFGSKDLLKIIDHVTNKDISEQFMEKDGIVNNNSEGKPAEIIIERDAADKKATHEELEKIKYDLSTAIVALNKTKDILALERQKQVILANELRDQKMELNFLQIMVEKLYKNNKNFSKGFFPRKENFTIHSDEILAAPLHTPKELPALKIREKLNDTYDKINEKSRESKITDQTPRIGESLWENMNSDRAYKNQQRARASELEGLERLLHQINKPKKSDIESKMFELQQEMDKKKEDEGLMKQLVLLQRLLSQQKEGQSGNLDIIKMLETATKHVNQPESKIIDDDMELELQKLQVVINNLRPKDDGELPKENKLSDRTKTETEQLREMLSKLLIQQAKKDEVSIDTGNTGHQLLSPKEFEALEKQLERAKILGGVSTQIHFPNNGYGYGPQFVDLSGRGPIPSEYSNGRYGNFGPNYPPYTNPQYQPMTNRFLNNNNGMYGVQGNSEFNGYSPITENIPSNLYQYQNGGQYSYYKPMSTPQDQYNFGTNMGQNTYQSSSNFFQRPLVKPIHPYNFEAGTNQNTYQSSSDLYQKPLVKPVAPNQYSFGASMEQNTYQGSSDLPQKPFVKPMTPNQYNFGANLDQNAYQSSSDYHQQPFAINAAPSGFSKPLEQGPKPLPYSQVSNTGQSYTQREIKNQFFPISHPNIYEKPISNTFYTQANVAGSNPGQSGIYSQQNTETIDYRHQKIQDLKTQIDHLQNIINDLNKPDYTQKPEDKETVANLERQISELNGIINGLNEDLTPNQPNYQPNNSPASEQNNQQQQPANYEKTSRRRRSLEDNQMAADEDSKLYDQFVTNIKQFLFQGENQTEKRSSYDDVQQKFADLKYQKPHAESENWTGTYI